jgi:hypothetical protein
VWMHMGAERLVESVVTLVAVCHLGDIWGWLRIDNDIMAMCILIVYTATKQKDKSSYFISDLELEALHPTGRAWSYSKRVVLSCWGC